MFQTKEQCKTLEKDLSEMRVCDLSDKEFQIMVIKIFTKVKSPWLLVLLRPIILPLPPCDFHSVSLPSPRPLFHS